MHQSLFDKFCCASVFFDKCYFVIDLWMNHDSLWENFKVDLLFSGRIDGVFSDLCNKSYVVDPDAKAELLLLKLIHLFARVVLLVKKLEPGVQLLKLYT